jgi:HEAT repeat protein
MKLDLLPRRSTWSLSVSARIVAILCAGILAIHAQDDPKSRAKAVKELAKQGATAIAQIAGYLADADRGVRVEAVRAIVQLDTQRSLDPLVKATADNDPEIQIRATDGLVNFYLPGYVEQGISAPFKKMGTAVKSRFTDTNDQVIDYSVQARPDIVQALGKLARGGASMEARAGAARALGILHARAALPDLIQALKSTDTDVNYEVLIAIQKIRDKSAGPDIAFRLRDPVEKVQIAAIETTGLLENRAAINQIRDVLDRTKKDKVRRAALTALAFMPDATTRGVFLAHLDDKDDALRVAAMEGLARLHDPSDQARFKKAFDEEKKAPGRLAGAFGLVYEGQREMTEFAPFRYLVNQLNSQSYRDVSIAYVKELARDPQTRQSVYKAFEQTPTKAEKTGLAQILGASGDRDSIPYLETLSKDPDADVDKEALRALQNLHARMNG